MTAALLASNHSSLQSLQTCEAHKEQLIQEIESLNEELKNVSQVSRFTPEIKKRIAFLEQKIEDNRIKIIEVDKMLELAPGSWVRNGTTKPGKVVELKIAGRIPEVHVQWAGDTVAVPERPMQLKLLQKEDIEYIWNGDRLPKLVRRIDHHECDEIEVLTDNLKRLSRCKELAISSHSSEDVIKDYSVQIAYCSKRITWVNREDLDKLEHIVKQGLDIFYRVGEALAEIRDRALYKDLGYSDFREYLEKRWDMGKSKAYRLIDAAKVVSNIVETNKSVPNWGQNLANAYETTEETLVLPIPKSEAITRELARLPQNQQPGAWSTALSISDNPTAADVRAVVDKMLDNYCPDSDSTVQNCCPDKESTVGIDPDIQKNLIDDFGVGQVVEINSDRSDKRLVGYNKSIALITAVNTASVDLKIWGKEFHNVSVNDIAAVGVTEQLTVCFSVNPLEMAVLLAAFDSKNKAIRAAVQAGSSKI